MSIKAIYTTHEDQMKKALEALCKDIATIRVGRATPSILDKVMVDYYGTPSPISQVASISVPEPRMIVIHPWEKTMLAQIEKAILKSDLGLMPGNDGMIIRLAIPQLTQERRLDLVKMLHKKAEEGRVVVRNVRREANDQLKKLEKERTISEDELKKSQEDMQKLTDKYIQKIDQSAAAKEIEIMEV